MKRRLGSTGQPDGPGWWLSTVEFDFFGHDDRPFESCVFWGPRKGGIRESEVLDRYHTEADAIAGHARYAAELEANGAKLESGWRP